MRLVTLITSEADLDAIQNVHKFSQPLELFGTLPYYLYLKEADWTWSDKYYPNKGYLLVPIEAVLNPSKYPECFI